MASSRIWDQIGAAWVDPKTPDLPSLVFNALPSVVLSPLFDQKVRSSAATMACFTAAFMSSSAGVA